MVWSPIIFLGAIFLTLSLLGIISSFGKTIPIFAIFLLLILIVGPVLVIYLALKYALINCVAVFEEKGALKIMQRSAFLARGKKWQIFGAVLLLGLGLQLFIPIFMIIFAGDASLLAIPGLILGLVIDILLVLFYWEARQQESAS